MPEINYQPSFSGDTVEELLAGGADPDDLIDGDFLSEDFLSPAEKEERRQYQSEYVKRWREQILTKGCTVVF
jgi:hypothetical protein